MKGLFLFCAFFLSVVSLAQEFDGFGVRADPKYLKDNFMDIEDYSPERAMDFSALNVAGPAVDPKDKSLRGVIIEKPAIIPLGDRQKDPSGNNQDTRARSFIFRNLDPNRLSFLLYPYNFTYTPADTSSSGVSASSAPVGDSSSSESSSIYIEPDVAQSFEDGALLSDMDTDGFPEHSYMKWLKATTDIDLLKAKPIYDLDIAVLQIQMEEKNQSYDITYDSDRFCSLFYNQFYPKYRKCFKGYADYESYIKQYPLRATEPIFVFVTPEDIANGRLVKDGNPRFGTLFFPDVMYNELGNATKLFNGKGQEALQAYLNCGGFISTTGKGALLLAKFGVAGLDDSSFVAGKTIISPNATTVLMDGCDKSADGTPQDNSEAEFIKRTLCFSHHHVQNSPKIYSALLSAPILAKTPTELGFTPILWLVHNTWGARLLMHNENTGLSTELPDGDVPRSYPSMMYKKVGKGFVVLHLANPAFSSWTAQYIYDTVFFAGSRPIALDNTLSGNFNRTIPALEAVQLSITLSLKNFFTQKISSASVLKVYQRAGTIVTAPSGFEKKTATSVPNDVLDGVYFEKTIAEIAETSTQDFKFVVKVIDPLVTQAGEDITILYPAVTFTDPRAGRRETLATPVTIAAAGSALLRADMNIDPSSTYPLLGVGSYIDNVMNCENKEATEARRVQQISIVPIISPLIGISDQVKLARAIYFDKEYYKKETNNISHYIYPFPENGNLNDYLDWTLLYKRGDVLAANWDEGVKIFREQRNNFTLADPLGIDPNINVTRASYQANIENDLLLLRQAQFYDSDKFYEHAVQRMMVFLDIRNELAARTYFGGEIPQVNRSASNPKIGKTSVLFVRHDVFFWKKYIMPDGLTDENRDNYITIDRFPENGECGSNHRTRPYPGVYQNDEGIIPAHFKSAIAVSKQRCGKNISLDKIEEFTHGKVKLVHYIVPVEPCDGEVAGDLLGFNAETGRHEMYPEISFERVMQAKFHIAANVSRRGGLMVFKFPTAPFADMTQAIKDGNITVAADQVAVYEMFDKGNNQLAVRFKRGMMPNEAYGRGSYLEMYFENTLLDHTQHYHIPMDLYEMTYDISRPESNYEDWSVKTISDMTVEFNSTGALRMPAVRFAFTIGDKLEDSFMNPYELREPLVRYGMYEQELLYHRPVHGADEFHPKMEPCVVTDQGGFSTFTHVGTSSVPFREYVTIGESLRIPGCAETGRLEWDDIWGRHFIQSVRSTIFEYPPIPPPLRNFEMTTTFELLTKDGKRMQAWRSNQPLDVHAQLKMINNYPKYFELTGCKANAVNMLCSGSGRLCKVPRIYMDDYRYVAPNIDNDSGHQFFFMGHNSSYGICFRDPDVYLKGEGPLTDDQRQRIQKMTLCANNVGSYDRSCETIGEGLPTLNKRPDGDESDPFNFAQQTEDFYPQNYIKPNMWDMTHYDYDDNQFDKAYKYHMDNRLPSIRSGLRRPQNHIAFPLYKGIGYSMSYNKTYTNPRFPKYRGWWSDNLQNHDHTLFAQQEESYDISLGRKNAISFFDHDLYEDSSAQIRNAETNIYSCHFNRKVPYLYADAQRGFFVDNVFENNVIPIAIDFNDKMEKHYECDKTYYSPTNISQFDNIIYTDTARDWLYFGANLRGNALEDLNIIYSLDPLEAEGKTIKFEGLAKVQDGGRFTYWNPANGPNSYLIVDDPVHTVLAMRNDIEVAQELIPTYTTTFDSNVYHHLTISDPEEIEREWELPIWTNNYGYGDFTVQVYVGDAGTTALPEPGTSLRIHYTFMNNAGFDIHMLKNAINSTTLSQESISSYQLMSGIVVALKVPDSYNFLNVTIPDELKPYVSLKPSASVVGIAPLFFDFDSINVVTIRDGWKGDYYYDLNVSKDFPDHLRGRLNEIKVDLVREYFDNFPGVGDPTKVHDYTVEIPPIVFGVPYAENSMWAGKVFYTSGYATQLHNIINVRDPYVPKEAIFVSEEDLEEFRACLGKSSDPDQEAANGEFKCLDDLWARKNASNTHCEYTLTKDEGSVINSVDFAPGLAIRAPQFPVKVAAKDGPDTAVLHIMLRTHADQIESGNPVITTGVYAHALDWMGERVDAEPEPYMTIHSKGAWLKLDWTMKLLSSTGLELESELLTPDDSGMADIVVTLTNTGDYYAYNVSFTLSIPINVKPAYPGSGIEGSIELPPGCTVSKNASNPDEVIFAGKVADVMVPHSPFSFLFRVQFEADTRSGAGSSAKPPLDMHIIATSSHAQIDLTATAGEKTVVQDLLGPYGFKYTAERDTSLAVLSATRDSSYQSTLKVAHRLPDITYYVWRAKTASSKEWKTISVTSGRSIKENVKTRFKNLGGSGAVKVDYVVCLTKAKNKPDLNSTVTCVTQSNVYKWRRSNSNLLLLLLLLPGLLIPAFIGAAVFSVKKGTTVTPATELGMNHKEKFVPQEMVDDHFEAAEMDMTAPPPSLPQRAAPYEPPEPEPVEMAQPGKTYALRTGPTYVQGGRGVQVVDSGH